MPLVQGVGPALVHAVFVVLHAVSVTRAGSAVLQYALVPYQWWWVLVWWFKLLRLNPARKFPAGLTGEVSPGGSIGNEAKGVMPSGRTCMYGKHYSLPVAIYHSSIPLH